MKQLFAKIHLWFSIPVGLVVTAICLSGAVLVFEDEITRALHSELYYVEVPVGTQPLAPSQLVARITEQMPDSLHLTSLQFSGRRDESCMVAFRETGRRKLSVNPYTGYVNGWVESSTFFSTVRKLHRWLLDPPESKGGISVGKIIVGGSTLCLVLILISGLIIWFPRNRKALPYRLKVVSSKGCRRFFHDCHVSLGFYSTLLLLVMALTGLTWSFGWYRTAIYALFGGGHQKIDVQASFLQKKDSGNRSGSKRSGQETADREIKEMRPGMDGPEFDYAVWDEVFPQLAAHYPGYKTIELTQTDAQIVRKSAIRRTDRVAIDPASVGGLAEITHYEDTPRQQRLRSWFYAFHTGSWGGIWTKLLYFIAAFIGATLPLTGYYLWWKRNFCRKTKR